MISMYFIYKEQLWPSNKLLRFCIDMLCFWTNWFQLYDQKMIIFYVNMAIILYNLYHGSAIESDMQYLLTILMLLEAKKYFILLFLYIH